MINEFFNRNNDKPISASLLRYNPSPLYSVLPPFILPPSLCPFPLLLLLFQIYFCKTNSKPQFFYLDFSLVPGSFTPISPMSPMTPATPQQSSIPNFPTGASAGGPKDGSAGIVFWGSAVIPMFEMIKVCGEWCGWRGRSGRVVRGRRRG